MYDFLPDIFRLYVDMPITEVLNQIKKAGKNVSGILSKI